MIRMGVFLTMIMVTINAGLLLTGDLTDNGAFADLSNALNQATDVGATTELNPEAIEAIAGAGVLGSVFGLAEQTIAASIAAIKISIFLLAGSLQLINLVDPTNTWSLIVLAPIAVIQVFYVLFLVITVVTALVGIARLIRP